MTEGRSVSLDTLQGILSKAAPRLRYPAGRSEAPARSAGTDNPVGRIANAALGNDHWHLAPTAEDDDLGLGFAIYRVAYVQVAVRAEPSVSGPLITLLKYDSTVRAVARRGLWIKLDKPPPSLGNGPSEFAEAWMLTRHEQYGALLEWAGGAKSLKHDLLSLGPPPGSALQSDRPAEAPGDDSSRASIHTAGSWKPAPPRAQLDAEQDSSGAELEHVRHTYQVAYARVFVRAAPSIAARVVGTLREGGQLEADGKKGPWVRAVLRRSTELSQDGDGWVLTSHHQHGELLRLLRDSSIVIP